MRSYRLCGHLYLGTIGSAIVLAQLGPKLIGVDLPAACAEYEKQLGATSGGSDAGCCPPIAPWTYVLPDRGRERAHRQAGARALPGLRIFVERVRRGNA